MEWGGDKNTQVSGGTAPPAKTGGPPSSRRRPSCARRRVVWYGRHWPVPATRRLVCCNMAFQMRLMALRVVLWQTTTPWPNDSHAMGLFGPRGRVLTVIFVQRCGVWKKCQGNVMEFWWILIKWAKTLTKCKPLQTSRINQEGNFGSKIQALISKVWKKMSFFDGFWWF